MMGYISFSYIVMGMFTALMEAPIFIRVASLGGAPLTMPMLVGAVLAKHHNDM
ncbi:TMhelix containing protein [Vibrio phage 1.076.O._10N.286.51.B7]|nr:TMhelix containing protein [Vibrio phage 1.076.O._10N.286.51.B7]